MIHRALLRTVLAFIIGLALPFPAAAGVFISSRSFVETYIDIQDKENGFRFERRYDSACRTGSTFGPGWRTGFDTYVIWYEGALVLLPFGCAGQVDYTIAPESIVELAKLGVDVTDVIELLDPSPPAKGVTLTFASSTPWVKDLPQNLTLSGGVYKGDTVKMEFDGVSGYATQIGSRRPVFDEDHNLLSLDVGEGSNVIFERPDERTIKAVYSREKDKPLIYRFNEEGTLASAKNSWGNTYTHSYDKDFKLTSMTWPDRTNIVLVYDPKLNWVTLYKDRDDCAEQYFFRVDRRAATLGGEIVRRCRGSVEPANHTYYRIDFTDSSMNKVTRVEEFKDTSGSKSSEHNITFYDHRKRVAREVKGFDSEERDLDKWRRLVGHEKSPVTGTPAIYFLDAEDGNSSDATVHVMVKGGRSSDFKGRDEFNFYVNTLNRREGWGKSKDFFKVAESFRIAESPDDLEEGEKDAIVIQQGTLAYFRVKGVGYEIEYDRDGSVIIRGDAINGELGMKDFIDPKRAAEAAVTKKALLWADARFKVYQRIEWERVR